MCLAVSPAPAEYCNILNITDRIIYSDVTPGDNGCRVESMIIIEKADMDTESVFSIRLHHVYTLESTEIMIRLMTA